MIPACERCKFYENGRCRRFPPSGRPSAWAQVHPFDWCGEFQAILGQIQGPLTSPEPVLAKKRGRPRKNPLPVTEVSQ